MRQNKNMSRLWLARNVYCQIPHLYRGGGNQQASGVEKKKDCIKSYLQLI